MKQQEKTMDRPVDSIVLVFNDRSSIDQIRKQLISDLSGVAFKSWPQHGPDFRDISHSTESVEFWVSAGMEHRPALSFDERHPGLFCFAEDQAWGWLLRFYYPESTIRFIRPYEILPFHALNASIQDKDYPFCLSYLRLLFHDISNLASSGKRVVCQKVARWLSELNQPVLNPFAYFGRLQNWGKWEDAIKAGNLNVYKEQLDSVKSRLQGVLSQPGSGQPGLISEKLASQNVEGFFYDMCRLYMEAAQLDEE